MTIYEWIIVHFFEIIGYLMAIILIPRILLERRHSGATIAWLLSIGMIPIIGVPLYFLIGGKRIKRISQKKNQFLTDQKIAGQQSSSCFIPAEIRKITQLLMNSGAFSPASGNDIIIIDDGIEAFSSLVKLLKNADKTIEIAAFILGRDEVGRTLVKLLAHKAKQGVKVRLLLDSLGCFSTKGKFVQPLKDAGGQIGIFLPFIPLRRRWSANLRNHRKMAIIDGYQAFVGGMNLAREYMGPTPYKKRWKDVSFIITGRSVEHIRTIFQQDWEYSTGEVFDFISPLPALANNNGSIVQVVGDGPDIPERPLYSGVLASINQARKSIWVVTPYFVPDEPLSAALELAARVGCDVRLIMPKKSNHPLVDLAGSSFLSDLMEAGVSLYRYQPGMLHAKLIAIDRKLAVIGSANMDIRSFQLNFEIATFLYNPYDVNNVIEVIKRVLNESRRVTIDEIKQKSKIRRFSEDICRVFSPLL